MNDFLPRQSTVTKSPLSALTDEKQSPSSESTPPLNLSIDDGDDAPSLPFRGVKELFTAIRTTNGDGLRITGVTPENFSRIMAARSEDRRFKLFFSEADRLVIVTIPTIHHESLAFELSFHISRLIREMDVRGLPPRGTAGTTFSSGSGHPFAGSSEGDGSFMPSLPGGEGRDWPSVMIEVGYTQSMANLRMKGRWWIMASDGAVKIVLLVKCASSQGNITIEQWKGLHDRPGATMTRAAGNVPALRPACVQTITISRPGVGNTDTARLDPNSYLVTRGPLRLQFRDVFDREAQDGEHDILLDDDVLKSVAIRAWQ